MSDILSLLQDFNVANFLPAPEKFLKDFEGWIRLAVLIGPLVMLALGLLYYYKPPKEANYSVGFRTYYGMGSIEAWRFTQKLAGVSYILLGGALTAVMFLISLFFSGKAALTMVNVAVWCILIELILIFLVWLMINVMVYREFDKDGKRRKDPKLSSLKRER